MLFGRKELLYDISNLCYVEGYIMPEEAINARHTTADVAQPGNVDRVTRILNIIHAQAVEILYPYTKCKSEDQTDMFDTMADTHTYAISIKVPDWFSDTTAQLLEHLIHEWMVAAVMADWLAITKPEAAAKWQSRTEKVKSEIEYAKNRHRRTFIRKCSPF